MDDHEGFSLDIEASMVGCYCSTLFGSLGIVSGSHFLRLLSWYGYQTMLFVHCHHCLQYRLGILP
ncbi:hypothetical protein BDV28DRAFT_133809 [Aspergillus coremiiformis]|uniref:Uncharacterized protein n=1 Tax=Aspergillus coremiiformis TaxID=138285 RepID=A0A5N6Z5W2_9EURO|nr:hypothetical protein BDV28DRAFT_133809 [Aspergillus coremiiformis]